jgi:hypothetical protein
MILSLSLIVINNEGVAGRVTEDHLKCQSQQHMSDDVFEETVSLSHLEKRARHQSAQHETL